MSYSFPTCPFCNSEVRSWVPRYFVKPQVVQCSTCGKSYLLQTWIAYECYPLKASPYVPLGKEAVGTTVRVRGSNGYRHVKVPRKRSTQYEELPQLDLQGVVEKVLAREVRVRVTIEGNEQVLVFRSDTGEQKLTREERDGRLNGGERRFWLSGEDPADAPAMVI